MHTIHILECFKHLREVIINGFSGFASGGSPQILVDQIDLSRVCKTPKIPETRPDSKFSGFLMSDLRNLKFFYVKADPDLNFSGLGFLSGFRVYHVGHHYNTVREKFLKRNVTFAVNSCSPLSEHVH